MHLKDSVSHPPKHSSVESAETQVDPWMHHLHPVPVRQSAQLYWASQVPPPFGPSHAEASNVQSAGSQLLTLGPASVPIKHELLVLHHPHPCFAMHDSQSADIVAQSCWSPAGPLLSFCSMTSSLSGTSMIPVTLSSSTG